MVVLVSVYLHPGTRTSIVLGMFVWFRAEAFLSLVQTFSLNRKASSFLKVLVRMYNLIRFIADQHTET
jgi:hypothetical protein